MKHTVLTYDGPQLVRGTVVGPFFVHRIMSERPKFWTISHLKYGRYVVTWINDRPTALKVARALARLDGWEQSYRRLKTSVDMMQKVKAVKQQFNIAG